MEPDEHRRVAAVEDHHWWYVATRQLLSDLASRDAASPPGLVLDAGCGTGGMGAPFATSCQVVGVDADADALALARSRHAAVDLARGDVAALPIRTGVADVVLCTNVLYTVAEPQAAMHELARGLAPGGTLIVVEPAFASLRRAHDRQVHGRRRFRRQDLEALASDAGLRPLRSTYAFSYLFPAAAALALWDRVAGSRPPTSDVDRPGPGWLLGTLARSELRWIRRRRVPLGTSVVMVATRLTDDRGPRAR